MRSFAFILSALLCLSTTYAKAEEDSNQVVIDTLALYEAWDNYVDSVESSFNYQYGEITLKDGLATLVVPRGYKYLDGESSELVLTELWGNPPSQGDESSLGMLFPEGESPASDSSFAINITYSEEGFIDDEDAADIDYEELLEQMQEDAAATNQFRLENGYETIELVGWAEAPHYDQESKKLFWAKEIKFGDAEDGNTLNYNIRILGRKGYLNLNAIGQMYVLDRVHTDVDPILTSINFNEGNKYSDFDPSIDKVAAYGIGGLIAGKALAKVGLLAKLGVILAKFWKFILIGIVGIGAAFKKYFTKPKESTPIEPENLEGEEEDKPEA